jgi:hypothetical protein
VQRARAAADALLGEKSVTDRDYPECDPGLVTAFFTNPASLNPTISPVERQFNFYLLPNRLMNGK